MLIRASIRAQGRYLQLTVLRLTLVEPGASMTVDSNRAMAVENCSLAEKDGG